MVKREISFNEKLHKYTDHEGFEYTSVTTLIGEYTPQFQKDYWSKVKAQEAGVSQQTILDNWKEITDNANEKGTRTHKILEDSINSSIGYTKSKSNLLTTALNPLSGYQFTNVNIDILANSQLALKYPSIFNYLKVLINQGCTIYVEKRVYSFEYLIAGTIDCLVIKGKQFMIVDWKTNKKELKFRSGYYKKINGIESEQWIDTNEYMLGPLKSLQHCKGSIYTMQLSLYAYLLELWGYTCIGLSLYHIRDNKEPKLYLLPYDRISCELLTIHHKNVLSQPKKLSINTKFGIS